MQRKNLDRKGVESADVPKRRKDYCGICRRSRSCLRSALSRRLTYFPLPQDKERRTTWLNIMGRSNTRDPLGDPDVCEIHFERIYVVATNNCKRLLDTAIPTLFLPDSGVEATTSTASTSGEESVSITEFMDKNDEEQEELLVANQVEFVPKFEKLPEVEGNTRRYSTEFKMFALELYFKSPLSYRVLHSSFSLPRISTLYRLCIPQTTELSQLVLRALMMKADMMTQAQKQCVVCLATTSIVPNIYYDAKLDKFTGFHEVNGAVQNVEPARTALVVFVRGLFHNWKQTVAFSFLSNFENYQHVKHFIDEIICNMFHVGLNVRALMTDLESDSFIMNERKICNQKPFFKVGNKTIYFMYDPLRLMKNVYDHLRTYHFVFHDGLMAEWQYVEECYKIDHTKESYRLAPQLSLDHIGPPNHTLDELKLTADVFSEATATALATYIDLKKIPPCARETALWITTMNTLKEMLNFSSINPPQDKTAVFFGKPPQVEFLMRIKSLFYNMRLLPRNVAIPAEEQINAKFIEGYRTTINALLLLQKELKIENCWFPVVGLSFDCLDMFISQVRQKHNGACPTAQQMTTCIRTFPIFSIFQYSCKTRCSNELQTFMSYTRQMPDIGMYEQEAGPHPQSQHADVSADDSAQFPRVDLPTVNRLQHLALYLLHKVYQQHTDCSDMNKYMFSDEHAQYEMFDTEYVANNGEIVNKVPRKFRMFIEALENKFKIYFREQRSTQIISSILRILEDVKFETPCLCFPLHYLKRLYLRFRLHLLLEYNNNLLIQTDGDATFVVNHL